MGIVMFGYFVYLLLYELFNGDTKLLYLLGGFVLVFSPYYIQEWILGCSSCQGFHNKMKELAKKHGRPKN